MTRRPRGRLAAALAAALALLVTLAAGTSASSPALAADPPAALTEGSLRWGFKLSWRNYAGPGTPTDGATQGPDGITEWPLTSGAYDPATETTTVRFGGSVRWVGHYAPSEPHNPPPPGYTGPTDIHILDVTLSDPEVIISREVQTLTVEAVSRSAATWEMVDYGRIAVAELGIEGITPTVADGVTTWSSVIAALSGGPVLDVFQGPYLPGTIIDPVNFSYTGPGGAPDTSEDWPEAGQLGIAVGPNQLIQGVGQPLGYATWHVDERNFVAHYMTTAATPAGQVHTIRAFDLGTLQPVGDPLVMTAGNPKPVLALFDPVTGRIFVRSNNPLDKIDAVIRWDRVAQQYVTGASPLPPEVPVGAYWDPVGRRIVTVARTVPDGVGSTDYDNHVWELRAYSEQLDGRWTSRTWILPNGPTGTNQNRYFSSFSPATPRITTLPDGSFVMVPPASGRLAQRIVLGATSATVTEVPDSAVPPPKGNYQRILSGPPGQVTMVSSGTGASVRSWRLESGQLVPTGERAVLDGITFFAATVDPTDGLVWVSSFQSRTLVAIRDGVVVHRAVLPTMHPRQPLLVGGPDRKLWVQSDDGASTGDVYGFQRVDRLGFVPDAVTSPESQTVTLDVGEASEAVTFSASGAGEPTPSLQWQVKGAGSSRFVDVPGETGSTLTVEADLGDAGSQYRALVRNAAGARPTEAATLTVRAAPAVAIAPRPVTVVAGRTAVLDVLATGNPEPTVQWQREDGTSWVDVEGATDATFTIPDTTVEMDGTRYRAELANDVATVHTVPVELTVTAPSTGEQTIEGGAVDWGVKASFRSYITGGIAHGTIEVTDGASTNGDSTYRFPVTSGAVDGTEHTAVTDGAVRFSGHVTGGVPLLDMRISDVRVRLDGDEGDLVADVASRGLSDGEVQDYDDVVLAELDLTGLAAVVDGDELTWSDVPATLAPTGVEPFADFYPAGTPLDPVDVTLELSGEEEPPARTATESFVTAALTDFVGPEPSGPDVAAGVAAIDGGQSRASYLRALVRSDDWLEAVVNGLYQDTLGRDGDAAGVAHWVAELRAGRLTVEGVAARVHSSPECFTACGGGTDAGWVDHLYRSLLGRDADAGGRAFWVGEVGRLGRTRVALLFHRTPESARARVRDLYQELLGRAPDSVGLAHWAGRIVREGDLTLAVHLAASSEYRDRAIRRFP